MTKPRIFARTIHGPKKLPGAWRDLANRRLAPFECCEPCHPIGQDNVELRRRLPPTGVQRSHSLSCRIWIEGQEDMRCDYS